MAREKRGSAKQAAAAPVQATQAEKRPSEGMIQIRDERLKAALERRMVNSRSPAWPM